jgi:hypothetical protein
MMAYRVAAGSLAILVIGCLVLSPVLDPAAQAQQAESSLQVLENVAAHPAPSQPLPYSHRTHLAIGLTCEACHTNPEPAGQMTFPATSTCMSCHLGIATDRPSIARLKEYSDSGDVIPWNRVYTLLPGVIWSHGPHLTAGVQCGACHGDVAQLDEMSMTTSVTSMASCISCHESHDASTECVTCHAWPLE